MREKQTLIGPDYIGIEDESINQTLSDSEVQGTNDEDKQNSCSCKEKEKCQVIVIGAVDAVGRSNSQAVVLLTATIQSPGSVESALRVWITLQVVPFMSR